MKVDDTPANSTRCLCLGCPTYDECMTGADERLFCSRGATKCHPSSNGCICGECPVWDESGLDDFYYCLEGAK